MSALLGSVYYELPDAWEGELCVDASAFLGRVVLLVPQRAKVKLDGLALLSSVKDERPGTGGGQDDGLVVRVRGVSFLSSVKVLCKLTAEGKAAAAKFGLVQQM